ncbi:XrtB/PEP-CTERM-associated polysaccharide biosynthesis outer membrane protein EpsL [Janthinobacterium lividum]
MPLKSRLRAACVILVCGMASSTAVAALSDTIVPFLSTSYSYDDNLLRLDDKVPGYNGPRSDTSRQIQAGFLVNRPFGRQILSGQAKWSRVSFQHFDQFNYSGKDFLADLEWHLGNHLDGHAGALYSQTLTPFSDFQSVERNLRTRQREYVDGGWRFHPSWRVRGAYSRERYSYDLLSQRVSNRVENASELGLDYLASSNSRIGVQLRHLKGNYPNRLNSGQFGLDRGYTQDEMKANVYWVYSAITQVQLLGGLVRRSNSVNSERDSSGANGRVVVNWAPLGKVRFTGSLWHEFGTVENALISSSLNNGASVAASWDITSKVRMDAQLRREKRDFSSVSGLVLPVNVSDNSHTESLGVTYLPTPSIQLGLNAFRETREGAPIINTGSYRAKGVSFSASVQL